MDYAATTPVDPAVIATMTEALQRYPGNPSSIHAEGREARALIEQARKTVAGAIGASIGEVFFTSGGTESTNMALKNAVRDLNVQRIISSPLEHHCVLHCLDTLQRTEGTEVLYLEVDGKGQPDLEELDVLLKDDGKKTLVSLMHANNEIGTLLDLDAVAALCREQGAFFHSDTVQTVSTYKLDVSRTPISFLTGSAHKFFGPKGVGFIYVNGDNLIGPYIDGGAQERNMRAGTENLPGILGMAKALELAMARKDEREVYVRSLRDALWQRLRESFDDLQVYGDPERGHYKLLNVSFPPSPQADLLLMNLDIAGISVSGGSACSSGADAGSHVLDALVGDPGRKAIRFSLSHLNTMDEVEQVVNTLKEILPASVEA